MNPPYAIFQPVVALVFLTFIVLLLVPLRRFKAAFARQVTAGDFRYGESARVPPDVSLPNRNLMNLLETPVLFYVVCLVLYAMRAADYATVILAWVYVALRVTHSIIHLSYNNVLHRLAVFAASIVVLISLWIKVAVLAF